VNEKLMFHLPDEILTKEKPEKILQPQPPTPPPVKKPEIKEQPKKATETPIVADKFIQTSNLYEEQTASIKTERDLSDHLKPKAITNLTEAIGISDKFLFISEIFDGNKDAYTQAISRLDKAESLKDAMAIIMSYTGEKPDNEAVIQLLDLVRLKLPANE
jgi:outer membrane biosynthesis protein TonB